MANQFGKRLKQLREQNNLLQRQVAALLEIDTPMLSKIERGGRQAKKDLIPLFAEIFKVDKEELVTLWLTDQISSMIKNEELNNSTFEKIIKNIKANYIRLLGE